MTKILQLSLGLVLILSSCQHDPVVTRTEQSVLDLLGSLSPTGTHEYYIFPESNDYSKLPNQDSENPIDGRKVNLGKLLFHETGLGQVANQGQSLETYSCASCHIAASGFTPGRIQGVADGAVGFGNNRNLSESYLSNEVDAQGIRPLSVLNVGYMTNALWSGTFGAHGVNEDTEDIWDRNPIAEINHTGFEGLEAQNIEGVKLHRMEITEKVLDEYGYRKLFDECFPEFPEEERYSDVTASFALAAYLRTLLAGEAPFQDWLKGDMDAMSEQEERGALLFLGKAGCAGCHNGPSFSSMEFHALGTADLFLHEDALNTSANDDRNLGRGFFTQDPEDYYKFKVPQLYNLKDYSHFFHGSSRQSIRGVIQYKILAQSDNNKVSDEMLSPKFKPLQLNASEIDDLTAFLENALYDSNLTRYVPESVLSGNCIPNNDPISKAQLGCE